MRTNVSPRRQLLPGLGFFAEAVEQRPPVHVPWNPTLERAGAGTLESLSVGHHVIDDGQVSFRPLGKQEQLSRHGGAESGCVSMAGAIVVERGDRLRLALEALAALVVLRRSRREGS